MRGDDDAPALVLTCEHAGNRVPRQYAGLFVGADDVLASHEGWDPGALRLARFMAQRIGAPLLHTPWSRLLVEANRASTNRRVWSRFTCDLPREERRRILEAYWQPHRQEVADAVAAAIASAGRVVHVAVHTFTPRLHGEVRNADVAFLYDSTHVRERVFARRWADVLVRRAPEIRVRYNYPYRGSTDGLPTWLRKRHPATRYIGYELEVNQAVATSPAWKHVGAALAAGLRESLSVAFAPPRRRHV